MKNRSASFIVIGFALLLSACGGGQVGSYRPSAHPALPPDCCGTAGDITLDFAALAGDVALETVAAQPAGDDGPWWEAAPQYRLLTLQGYPVTHHESKPQIFVYPAAGLAAANEYMGQAADELEALLQTQQVGESLPFLPLINARQVLHPQTGNLDFKNGKGIRFLTMYSQGLVPINNQELIYTFQGLTGDGKYYIAAVLPVTHPKLPDDPSVNDLLTGVGSQYQNYISKTASLLDQEPAGSFTPDLSKLDALIRSLEVKSLSKLPASEVQGMQRPANLDFDNTLG